MLNISYVKALSEHYAKMFDTTTAQAGAITDTGGKVNTLIFVGMPSAERPYYKLGTIGMSDTRQHKTRTPYTELVMTLPAYWQFNTGQTKWDWPIDALKAAVATPAMSKHSFTYYSSFALNEQFDTFDKSTDKCAMMFAPLAQFDNKKYGVTKIKGRKVHFLQVFGTSKYTYDVLDKPNRKELVNKLISSQKFDFLVY